MIRVLAVLVLLTAPAAAKVDEVNHMSDGSTVTFFNGYHSAIVSGRHLRPLGPKLNPIWWFKNDFEPNAPSWYEPGKPNAWRQFSWYMRNPWQNAGRYVFGIADRNYRVDGNVDLRVGADLIGSGRTGCIRLVFSRISGLPAHSKRYFNGCTRSRFVWYAGTQWTGFYGLKFNLLHSRFQLW